MIRQDRCNDGEDVLRTLRGGFYGSDIGMLYLFNRLDREPDVVYDCLGMRPARNFRDVPWFHRDPQLIDSRKPETRV
jgi:hypothetical protein